ncbi:serine/threonine protein kinase [Xenorhabdus sp. DI]|uniref:serine/threonine protein kinase n=1 Tax=Xenorhabdus doucetiae TaxID=351671 RepID=UPI0019BEBE04|nr:MULTISPECIES: serine/threonine-protein kinase [unclassified Xenorhabdus]MBD2785636.1 serine/threonine protein kinase [Xenorhabdus sp. 3]MBD2787021.1 serine/threonine protein kinase [Xenorhabdus sp. DI]MBD2796713.1 serine/threonine protein kinase [Xenorhabdus sp. 18]
MQNFHRTYDDGNMGFTPPLPIGYCLNEFEIEEVISKSRSSIVYRVWDHHLKQAIAIKEYMPHSFTMRCRDMKLNLRGEKHSRREKLRKRFHAGLQNFIREAHLMSCFEHPCLPRFLRFWQQNCTAYIAMPFYKGITLNKLWVRHPHLINENWLCRILLPLLDALDTLHQRNYLHCDISLDNIFIQENQSPLLLDLGSSRQTTKCLSDDTEITVRSGFTPVEQYTANEENQQGPWTDIYALGAVLYTLIVGAPPPVSIVRNLEDNYQPLAKLRPMGYSLSFLHAVDSALAINPSERPPSITEFVAILQINMIPPRIINQ